MWAGMLRTIILMSLERTYSLHDDALNFSVQHKRKLQQLKLRVNGRMTGKRRNKKCYVQHFIVYIYVIYAWDDVGNVGIFILYDKPRLDPDFI